MKEKTKTLVLLDSHAIIHRAYHALPDFVSINGEPTGALYGLSSMLMKIITDLNPDYIVACYDLPQKTFRHEVYADYKIGRKKADEALVSQLISSREIFKAFNIPIYDSPGFEADDLLGTIVHKLKNKTDKEEIKIIIASGDMDTLQLVDDKKVQVYTLKKGITDTILYSEKKVIERFNFKPEFLPDYKGLRGDPSDNIIGIKGIGEKTATKLISKFSTIENLYKEVKKDEETFKKIGITPRIFNLIKENEEEALFSKTLATIRRDAPIKFLLPQKTFNENLSLSQIEEVFNKFNFKSLLGRLKFFFKNRKAEFAKEEFENFGKEDISKPKEKIKEKDFEETSIALWLINSDNTSPSLEDILNFPKKFKRDIKDINFKLARKFIFEKLEENNLDKIYKEIEHPIIPIIKKMEEKGILIDKFYFKELSKNYHSNLDKLTKKIYKLAGKEFNINSPKQLSEILFDYLNIKNKRKRGASGSYSTKISILEELIDEHLIIKEIIAYRELQKLLSTYIDVIPKMVAEDGRLHAKFLQNNTTTGRFSSQNPNLQNLPIKSKLGIKIRGGFVANKGYKLCAFDYSQVELRVVAMLSFDKNMTKIFKEKKDIHAGVASFVFGVPLDKVNSEQRRQAKVINFGIIYGMGVNSLRKSLGGTKEEAQMFYDNYFKQFKGVASYLEGVKDFAKKNFYTETLFGRRRYFPNINSRIPFLKSMALRTAINAPVQGTAADIIKLAIRFVDEDLEKENLKDKVHLVLQIHDELVYEIAEDVLDKVEKIIKKAMEEVLERSYLKYKTIIPLLVHMGVGNNLEDVK